jgi:hypothetical protein
MRVLSEIAAQKSSDRLIREGHVRDTSFPTKFVAKKACNSAVFLTQYYSENF